MSAIRITNYCQQFQTSLNKFNVIVDLWLMTGDCNRLKVITNKRVFRITKSNWKWFWMTKIWFEWFQHDFSKMKMNFSKFGIRTAIRITNYCKQFQTILNYFKVIVDLWLMTGDGNRLKFILNKRVIRVTKSNYK